MTSETSEYVCPYCDGSGVIPIDEFLNRQCQCSYIRSLKLHLGPEISSAPFLDVSPLYVGNTKPGDPPQVDKTITNLLIESTWVDLLPHLKWALGCKGLGFYTKIVTDERLKSVWFGNEKQTQKGKSSEVSNNSLSDLIGEDNHLVIIRLGCLGYKNVAMPGILKEALILRQVYRKATWLVYEPSEPFLPGHRAYSDEVYNYIRQNKYEPITIEAQPGVKVVSDSTSLRQVDQEGAISMGYQEDSPRPRKRPDMDVSGLGMPGESSKPKYSYTKKRKSSDW